MLVLAETFHVGETIYIHGKYLSQSEKSATPFMMEAEYAQLYGLVIR